jgi:hypothetical protein
MPTFTPVNLELTENVGTAGTTVTINPDPVIFPALPRTYSISNVVMNYPIQPSDLNITWSGNQFTFRSTFADILPKTYKYLVYDKDNNVKNYYSVAHAADIPSEFTGLHQYVPPSPNYIEVPFRVTCGGTTSTAAGYFVTGQSYTISQVNNTDFTLIGASANTVGTTFTASGPGTISALTQGYAEQPINVNSLTPSSKYTVSSIGTTDFTTIGAAASFTATTMTCSGTVMTVSGVTGTITAGTLLNGTANVTAGTSIVSQVTPLLTVPLEVLGGAGRYNISSTHTISIAQAVKGQPLPGTEFTASSSGTGTGLAMPCVGGGYFTVGKTYKIITPGTTTFTAIGSTDNLAGTIFTAIGSGQGGGTATELKASGSLAVGSTYKIQRVGDTPWTTLGASSNTVGTTFTATAVGSATVGVPGRATQPAVGAETFTWTLVVRYNDSLANLALKSISRSSTTYKEAQTKYPELD